jgi:hypothetical protein
MHIANVHVTPTLKHSGGIPEQPVKPPTRAHAVKGAVPGPLDGIQIDEKL